MGLATRAHVWLGWGMRGEGPPKTRDTSHHEHQRDRVSSDLNGGRRPPSLRPSQMYSRLYIRRIQWVSGHGDRRRFGDQRQPQHQLYDGERHERIEWHQHRTFPTNNPHSDDSRWRDDMNQSERRHRHPRCWYCYEPRHTYQQCRLCSPSIPGGPCFLYSVIKICSTQLAPNLDIEVESILDKMHSELATCPNVYTAKI